MKEIIITGAGISGLTTAYWLKKAGYKVVILEAKDEPGGAMITEKNKGFLIDYGPNSGLETTPLIRQIAEELNFSDQMIYANEASNKRYILKNNRLTPLPTDPLAFITSRLFSPFAKVRLMAEPFIGKSADGYYQSIAEFVKRRLGREFLDYAIDPFVSGVFAGDPNKLSVKSAFPKLYRLEEVYGGLIKGMIKGAKERKQNAEKSKQNAKMFTFVNGMQSFAQRLSEYLEDSIIYNAKISKVSKSGSKFSVEFRTDNSDYDILADAVITTTPAYVTADYLGYLDKELDTRLRDIYYPPVKVLFVGYPKEHIKTKLDGFGFLIPSKENKNFLGAIWSSSIFPNRSYKDYAAFTLFIGGARNADVFKRSEEMTELDVLDEFQEIMKIDCSPIIKVSKTWENAIPQYNLGYIEHENYFGSFEEKNPGIFLSGNFRNGISVGDCVKNSHIVFDRVQEYCNKTV